MSDCRFGVSPVNYPDPDPDFICIVCAKYQKASVKALVQVNFLMNALSKRITPI